MDRFSEGPPVCGEWFGHLSELTFSRQKEPQSPTSFLELALIRSDGERIVVKFHSVTSLEIGSLCRDVCCHIRVLDISGDQLEGMKFRVTENENRLLRFDCNSFQIEVL